MLRAVDALDQRVLSKIDGFRTAKAWLVGYLGLAGPTAARLVKVARLLRQLPLLAATLRTGNVSPDHLQHVARMADRVDASRLPETDAILADAVQALDPGRFQLVCQRVEAHLAPDGSDPGADFERRGLTLSPLHGLTAIHGQLDPEGAAALTTALEALMAPPAADDDRTAAQRRADALVELARLHLSAGDLPTVGRQRPHVGVLLFPQALSPATLAALAARQESAMAAQRLRQFLAYAQAADSDSTDPLPAVSLTGTHAGDPSVRQRNEAAPRIGAQTEKETGRPMTETTARWAQPGWADPPYLDWIGAIPPEVAQRLACDADIWRIVLDPANSMLLDVGRAHRLVPYWMRRALHARDRGCRWPGCQAPVAWTDAHHLDGWFADNGETSVDRCVLLCRWHHSRVHEGQWRIDLDPRTGEVLVTRPHGMPYHLPRGRSPAADGPTANTA